MFDKIFLPIPTIIKIFYGMLTLAIVSFILITLSIIQCKAICRSFFVCFVGLFALIGNIVYLEIYMISYDDIFRQASISISKHVIYILTYHLSLTCPYLIMPKLSMHYQHILFTLSLLFFKPLVYIYRHKKLFCLALM